MTVTAFAESNFALNHMAAPQLDLAAFFGLARSLGLTNVEIRNDIAGQAIADGSAPGAVRTAAVGTGMNLLTINALQRFNDWNAIRATEAAVMAAYALECGAKALILVPTNDGSGREDGVRQAKLREALAALKPILMAQGIVGLVEPLGFEACSLRSKREAVEGIRAVDGETVFRITHDTFHHALAGEPALFPEMTGLVHTSGVEDPTLRVAEMRDAHRVLVGPKDRLGNIEQLRALRAGGYAGPLSFEPFAPELRLLADPAAALRASMDFIRRELGDRAA